MLHPLHFVLVLHMLNREGVLCVLSFTVSVGVVNANVLSSLSARSRKPKRPLAWEGNCWATAAAEAEVLGAQATAAAADVQATAGKSSAEAPGASCSPSSIWRSAHNIKHEYSCKYGL